MENLAVFERQFYQAALSWSPEGNDFSDAQHLAVGARHTTELENSSGKQGFERFLRLFAHCGGKAELSRWKLAWRLGYQPTQAFFLAGGDAGFSPSELSILAEPRHCWCFATDLTIDKRNHIK